MDPGDENLKTEELTIGRRWRDMVCHVSHVPLEFSRLSIDSIIVSVAFLIDDPFNPFLPSFVGIRMFKNPPEAQHRIREDIDFCALKIDDCFITNQ